MGRIEENIRYKGDFGRRVSMWILPILLRVLAWLFCSEFLSRRAELVVPQNSFSRLSDGISMQGNGISPYDGDMFHYQPIILYSFATIIDRPYLLLFLFIGMDIAIAELLRAVAVIYLHKNENLNFIKVMDVSNLVAKCYLLNPIAIGSCAVLSLSVLNNFFLACFLYAFIKDWAVCGAVLCSFLTHLALYPVIFLCALVMKHKATAQKALVAIAFFVSLTFFIGINYALNGNFDFLDSTYIYLLDVRELTPNVGIFWYFFIEVFSHFRLFFLWVFQINILVYVFPLLFTVRDNSFLLLHLYLILISVFSSYPSMAESLIYLSLVPVFSSLHKYIRWGLLISGTLVTCTALASIMWLMWIVIGSANANFYFAVTLAYSVAQIFLLTDLLYAYLHKKVAKERGEAKVKDCTCFVLK